MDSSGHDPGDTATPTSGTPGSSAPEKTTQVPESAEHFENVLRRLVIEKEKSRAVPRAPLR